MSGNNGKYRTTAYERELEAFTRYFDLDLFALELLYNEPLGNAIHESVQRELDLMQIKFDRMIEIHPDTVAERERWKENREEMAKRLARSRHDLQRIPARRAAQRLARCWGAHGSVS